MTGTLVNSENMYSFLPALGKKRIEDSDLIVGVIDEKTDTACGVLWAEATDEDSLDIRFIYVEEEYRDRGAGKELLDFLIEIAAKIGIESITCSYINSEDRYYLYQLLDKAGFVDVSDEVGVYALKFSQFYIDTRMLRHPDIKIMAVNELEEKKKRAITKIDISDCREDISVLALKGDEVVGGMIFRDFRNMLENSYVDVNCENGERVMYMLCQKNFSLMEKYVDPDTWILVYADTDEYRKTLELLSADTAIAFYDYFKFNLTL